MYVFEIPYSPAFLFLSLSLILVKKFSQWKTRSRIQYRRSLKYILCPLWRQTQDTKSGVVSMTFRVIIPAAYPQDWHDERAILGANKSRAVVGFHRASCSLSETRCDPLFLFLTHKKRSHRRGVTYGIAYYTGIIPAGPIRDFSASVYDRLSFSLFSTIFLFHQSRNAQPRAHAHTCAWDIRPKSLSPRRVPAFGLGGPTRRRKARIRATMSAVSGLSSHSRYGIICTDEISRIAIHFSLLAIVALHVSPLNLLNAMIVFMIYIWDNDVKICNNIICEVTEYFDGNPRIPKLYFRSRYNLRN